MAVATGSVRDEILEQIQGKEWIHRIDLGHGVTTPGRWALEVAKHNFDAIAQVDFRDKKVLDIGCLDGLYTFEAEKRGAREVYATDLVTQVWPPRDTTFQIAHRILGSTASYHPHLNVYDVRDLGVDDFDVVLFLGVYYHLRDPLLAFSRLRQVMKEGALIVIEGEVLPDEPKPMANFYYRTHIAGDRSNWWVPSIPCLREWVESCFFEIVAEVPAPVSYGHHYFPDLVTGRHTLIAKAVCRADDNWIFPDAELKKFDLHNYDDPASIGLF